MIFKKKSPKANKQKTQNQDNVVLSNLLPAVSNKKKNISVKQKSNGIYYKKDFNKKKKVVVKLYKKKKLKKMTAKKLKKMIARMTSKKLINRDKLINKK